MKISLRKALMFFGIGISTVPMAVMAGLIAVMQQDTAGLVKREFEKAAQESSAQTVSDIIRVCEIIDASKKKSAQHVRDDAISRLYELGMPSLTEDFFTAPVKDQYDASIALQVSLNKLAFGAAAITPEFDKDGTPRQSGGPVQEILNSAKGADSVELTLFVRMNPEGDMLRVATTALRNDGTPYIGTYIPAINADGTENAIISKILLGERCRSFSDASELSFETDYEPIFDKNRNVIGMFSYGVPGSFANFICDYLQNLSIGKNGYVWVVESAQSGRPVFKVTKGGAVNSSIEESIEKNSAARARLDKFIDGAKNLEFGEIKVEKYELEGIGASGGSDIMVSYAYFAPWRWIIGVTAYQQDYDKASFLINREASSLLKNILWASVFLFIIIVGLAYSVSGKMSKPFEALRRFASRIQSGDIKGAGEIADGMSASFGFDRGELGGILSIYKRITTTFSELIGKVKSSADTLTAASDRIAAGAAKMEADTAAQTRFILEVGRTNADIVRSAGRLSVKAKNAAAKAENSIEAAKGNGKDLEALLENSAKLSEAAEAISARLAIMKQKADAISSIVTTIGSISEKTNLLSLNAAIEANKSGDYGKGFGSVSAQIRKLSDQTAVSAMHIRNMVRQMQESVEGGVKDMESFSGKVAQAHRIINEAEGNLSKIISQVIQLGPKFETMAKGVGEQSESAGQISSGITKLESSSMKTNEKISSFKYAAEELRSTGESLKEQISAFKV